MNSAESTLLMATMQIHFRLDWFPPSPETGSLGRLDFLNSSCSHGCVCPVIDRVC